MIRLFAYFDNVIGVAAICTAFAVAWFIENARHLSTSESILIALIAGFGIAGLAASYGLLRTQSYGLSLHRLSAWAWLAAAGIGIAKAWGTTHLPAVIAMAGLVAIPAFASLRYFARPAVAERFEIIGPDIGRVDDSPSWPARLLLAADVVIILAFARLLSAPRPRFGPTTAAVVVTDTAASFDKATKLYHSGRSGEAIPLFEQIVRQHPDHALAQARLGGAYCDVDQYRDAIPHLQRAIALDATDFQSRSNLGLAYQRLGQPELGIEPARQATLIAPANAVVFSNLGWILLQAKRPAEAVDPYVQAVRLHPNDAQTHYYLGVAYLGAGKPDLAEAEQQKLRQLDRDYARQLAELIYNDPTRRRHK